MLNLEYHYATLSDSFSCRKVATFCVHCRIFCPIYRGLQVLIFTSPWLLIPWVIIYAWASALLWGEEVVEAQKNGFETPPSWEGSYSGFGGLFGDFFLTEPLQSLSGFLHSLLITHPWSFRPMPGIPWKRHQLPWCYALLDVWLNSYTCQCSHLFPLTLLRLFKSITDYFADGLKLCRGQNTEIIIRQSNAPQCIAEAFCNAYRLFFAFTRVLGLSDLCLAFPPTRCDSHCAEVWSLF